VWRRPAWQRLDARVALATATASDGRSLLVKVYGRDAWDGQLLASTWSALWHRGESPHLGASRLQLVEHEAFLTLVAERGGVPVMPGLPTTPGTDALRSETTARSFDSHPRRSTRATGDRLGLVERLHGWAGQMMGLAAEVRPITLYHRLQQATIAATQPRYDGPRPGPTTALAMGQDRRSPRARPWR
jgi:hypothetical protein